MAKMKAVQVPKAGADFEIVEREIPQPSAGQVRIHVQACGICHSDVITKEGLFPGITYPRVPGHEVAGVIDELGADVKEWQKGQRVGVGWHGGQDGTCLACRLPKETGSNRQTAPTEHAMGTLQNGFESFRQRSLRHDEGSLGECKADMQGNRRCTGPSWSHPCCRRRTGNTK